MPNKDHRELGRIMDLFSFQEIAPGAPFWHDKGMVIFRQLEKAVRQINDDNGYEEISTPILVKREVFEKSGHWDHFRKNMFYFDNPIDKKEHLVIKPMNCPESTYVFNNQSRSYKDLPLRLAEIGRLYRNELSGTLGGLFRVRQLTMDDAHIYCLPEQAESEVKTIVKIIDNFYSSFDLKTRYVLATRPTKYLGTKKDWDEAEKALADAMDVTGVKYEIEKGSGAFYGPKMEAHAKDSQGRDWQLGTAQLDLVMLPKQFKTHYIDQEGKKKLPWVIHRAVFGTFERFVGLLLEHTDGHLPLWLAPTQATIINISDSHRQYAEQVKKTLEKSGLRVELSADNLTVGKRIREAEIKRSPYILVVGDKEIKNKTVSVRHWKKGDLGAEKLSSLTKKLRDEAEFAKSI